MTFSPYIKQLSAADAIGNKDSQEYGDPAYRYLDLWVDWLNYNHVGIYAGMRQSDGVKRVMHAMNDGDNTSITFHQNIDN